MNTLDVGSIPTSPKKVLDNNFKIVYNTIVPRERDAEMPEKAISKCSKKIKQNGKTLGKTLDILAQSAIMNTQQRKENLSNQKGNYYEEVYSAGNP